MLSSRISLFAIMICVMSCMTNQVLFVCATECSSGKYGDDCSGTCSCQNGADCDHVTGQCTCTPGYQGKLCGNGEARQCLSCCERLW